MSNKKTQKLVLLDMHAILHRAYHALPDFSSPSGEPTGALYGLSAMLLKIIDDLKPDYIAACFDLPKPTFRKKIYAQYKDGRKETEESLKAQIMRSRDVLDVFGIPYYEEEGFEADDLLGSIAELLKDRKDISIVIASGDMDTLQLVDGERVQVYTLRRGLTDTVVYDEKGVQDRFTFGPEMLADYKGLRGDPSDNIPGVRGVGEKTATTLITSIGGIDEIYKTLKEDEDSLLKLDGISKRVVGLLRDAEDEARFSKMLATIKNDVDVSFKLPEERWEDVLDIPRIEVLFKNLGFKSLLEKIYDKFGEKSPEQETLMENLSVNNEDVRRVGVALWLCDSEKTHPDLEDILSYTGTDSFEDAQKKIFAELDLKNLRKVYEEIELPLIPIVDRMHEVGVRLDVDYLQDLSLSYHKELSKLEKLIYSSAGVEFNINSPKQLGDVLFEKLGLAKSGIKKTSTGQRSTRESELQKLKGEHEVIEYILEYRALQKLVSTYIDVLPKLTDENNRLHAEFIQDGTTTGRMSSQNPNLQNIPIRTAEGRKIRNAFVAKKGYTLVALDYSQIELRIAAMLSKDEKLLSIFKEGKDVHSSVAQEVFGVSEDNVDKEVRNKAKVINFGILYGMGVNALRQNLGGVSQKEAKQYLEDYFDTFKGLTQWIEETKAFASKNGYTETLFGRRRYFSAIRSRMQYVRAAALRMAVNAPIQGTQADVIKKAMIEVDKHIQKEGLREDVRLLLQIHDELVYEIRNEKVDDIAHYIKDVMESIVSPDKAGIVFKVDAEKGESWGTLEKL